MPHLRRLLCFLLLTALFGWSGRFVADELEGTTRIPSGFKEVEVGVALRLRNVRPQVRVTADCKWSNESAEEGPVVRLEGIGGNETTGGVVSFDVPTGEDTTIDFRIFCVRAKSGATADVDWYVNATAEEPGGCTRAGCSGPATAVSFSITNP